MFLPEFSFASVCLAAERKVKGLAEVAVVVMAAFCGASYFNAIMHACPTCVPAGRAVCIEHHLRCLHGERDSWPSEQFSVPPGLEQRVSSTDNVSTGLLDGLRRRVAATVAAEGAEAHQVEVDHLVWAYAHSEAGRAMTEWATSSGHPVAAELASVAQDQARRFLAGSGPSDAVETDLRLASIAGRLTPLEDAGASEDHRLLRASLRDFAEREIGPHAQDIHRRDLDIPERIISGAAALGLFGLSVPTEYGGAQEAEDCRAMLITTEELSRASLAAGGSLITRPEILVRALLRGGTQDQKQRWLPAIASGEKVVAVAVAKAGHGSDVAGITCRATPLPGGDWEISGTKLWCTFAGRAELLMVLCRTAGRRAPGAVGVRGGKARLRRARVRVPAGRRDAAREGDSHHRLSGNAHVRARLRWVPGARQRAGRPGPVAESGLLPPDGGLFDGPGADGRPGRGRHAGRAGSRAGVRQNRIVFGKPVLDHQLIRARIGWMALRVHASRRLGYRAARLLDQGKGQMEASLAKLYASRMAELVTRDAMQVHGAMATARRPTCRATSSMRACWPSSRAPRRPYPCG